MCPIDPSPHGAEILHAVPERSFFPASEEAPGIDADQNARHVEAADGNPHHPDIAHRPALPDRPEQMAADVEDEEEDPVVDSGPGIADGPEGLTRQRG